MPLGNPIQQSSGSRGAGTGAAGATRGNTEQPWRPTRGYGGGAGQILTNAWGAKTSRPAGGPMPSGTGAYGFGQNPFTGYSPQSKADADAQMDLSKPQGQLLKQQIEEYRRNLMKGQKSE